MKSAWKKGIAAAAFAIAVLAAGVPAHAESYTFTNLVAITSGFTPRANVNSLNRAFGINDSGSVVGLITAATGTTPGGVTKWDLSSDGKTAIKTIIGYQPLAPTYTSTKAFGYGINGSGQIAGYQGNSPYYAFLYDPATHSSTYLGKPTGTGQAVATAINNSGQVVGYAGESYLYGAYAPPTAYIYSGGTNNRIPGATRGASVSSTTLAGSVATSISNTGLVTGFSTNSDNIARAFIYDTGKLQSDINNSTTAGFQSLGTLAALSASANYYGIDINDSGAVVGYTSGTPVMDPSSTQLAIPFNNVTNSHAFLYTNKDGMIDLGALAVTGYTGTSYAKANAINNNGVIVGTSNGHAFIYENNQMYDLNNLIGTGAETGFTLTNATGINNLGQIVGYGTNSAGMERAFALTITPTPIPPAVFLFGSGLAGLGYFRRRQKVQ